MYNQGFNPFMNTMPTSTQPYGYSMNNIPNYMQQQQNQIPQKQIVFQDIRFVNEDEAKSFIVLNPNSRVLLLDIQNGIAWLKSTDSLGLSYTERYKFDKILENKPQISDITDNYVKKEDLPEFATKNDIKGIYEQINNIKKEIEKKNLPMIKSGV